MGQFADPVEWAGIIFFLGLGIIPIISFLSCAYSNNWKLWFSGTRFPLPLWTLPALPFALIYSFASLATSVGIWFIWREDLRSTTSSLFGLLPPTGSGSDPSPLVLVDIIILLYLVHLALKISTACCFWAWQAFITSSVLDALQLLTLLTVTIMAYFIWWVPGVILTVPFVWELYVFSLTCYIAKCWNPMKPACVTDHIGHMWQNLGLNGHNNCRKCGNHYRGKTCGHCSKTSGHKSKIQTPHYNGQYQALDTVVIQAPSIQPSYHSVPTNDQIFWAN